MATTSRISCLVLRKNCCMRRLLAISTQDATNIYKGACYLYTDEALKITDYVQSRERTAQQFANMQDKFRERMKVYLSAPEKHMIFTEDLKNMVHMIENKKTDLDLCFEMLERFNKQKKDMRFGTYVFGPVVMRSLHFLGLPDVALNLLKKQEFDGFFDQLTSYVLLLDLLYKKGQYEKVVDAFEILKSRQLYGCKFPRDGLLLVVAACYHLNTSESYKYTLKLLEEAQSVSSVIGRRALAFAAAMALKQTDPRTAVELLSAISPNYITIRNLRLMAMADLDRIEDAFHIVNHVVYRDNPDYARREEICEEAVARLNAAVQRQGNKEHIQELKKLEKGLREGGHISRLNLESLLCAPVEAKSSDPNQNRLMPNPRNMRRRETFVRRKGLADMEE